MAKLGSINFDNRILDAARNGTLVVFAGAGVSMGPPSNLPSFQVLAECIANGTGVAVGEPLDRFLGHLQGRGIPVHERAAKQLSVPESQPKQLHQDLLKIFGTVDRVRIVTTNFDSHFESASIAAFGKEPDLYRAPALPRGSDFNGIIHVHGALSHPADLVLTDADFGRAYLTEGWARRFLVEVFRRYTVLFVGYSHDDVVMNYLSRALPADGVVGRFALTEKEGNWKILGITPIRFELAETGNSYKALEDGVHKLVELASRGVLDWRQRLTDLGTGAPPVDDEVVDEIEEGLREVHTTRFLLRAANGAEWLRWFDARHHFDALFGPGALSERESMLMNWLVSNFALKQPYEVFRLIALHGGRLSTALWSAFVLQIGTDKEVPLEASVLAKWVTILLATRPPATDRTNLVWLAERCADAGENTLTLKIFLYLCQHETTLTATSSNWNIVDEDEAPHRRFEAACVLGCDVNLLSDLWTDHVKPNLPVIALPLLSGITKILEDIQRDLATWDMVSDGWDPHSYHRSAIERHEQDRFPEPIDVLIDAARDALEHMVESHPLFVEAWIENVNVEVSLLRRLAVHASTVRTTTSADERLNWILRRVGLEGTMEHHEVYRATAISYPLASDDMRRTLVDAVLAIKVPAAVDWSAEKMTDWSRFAWLSWLLQARPDCIYAQAALEPIKQRHPEWELEEHPDFTHYSGMTGYAGNESPWPTEQLLAKSAQDQLDQLLTYEGARLFGPSRSGLLMAVTTACKRNPQWAFGLIVALIAKGAYSSDLLAAALRGFNDSELTADEWHELLTIAGKLEIQAAHGTDIARLLVGLVKDGGKPFALDLLDKANEVALGTWQSERHDETDQQVSDWLATAINRSSGIIVEYWLASLAVLMHGKSGDERFLPSAYKSWFESVLIEPGPKGGYGRALLASQIAFLSGMDDVWTREQVLPLFTDSDSSRFAQAWHGFLAWGQLNQTLAAEMLPGFRAALSRMKNKAPRRRRFIEFYAAIAVFYADDPMQNLLPDLMHLGAVNDRVTFAGCIGNFLRTMETGAKRALWDRWLKRYWELRLDGTDAPLDEGEIEKMLNWLAYLDDSFVEGVALAVQAPHVVLDHSSLLLELRKNELVVQFPEAGAQLLIYLCDCVRSYFIADLATIANRLPPLPLEVDRRLKEQMARVGAI
nr:DUF4020 domain-containing protein [Duganella sp. SG902]